MFAALLIAMVSLGVLITSIVVLLFRSPVRSILCRLAGQDNAGPWVRFLLFVMYVVGISSSLNVYRLEKYVSASSEYNYAVVLDRSAWLVEICQSFTSVLDGLAWYLMAFFIIALIGLVIVRIFELKRDKN